MITKLCVALTTMLFAVPLLAQTPADIPDIRGKWVGKNRAIVAGRGAHWPSGSGSFEKPLIGEKEVITEIVGQDGASFWGTNTLIGKGEKTIEPLIGQLTGPDKRRILIADTDGYIFGRSMFLISSRVDDVSVFPVRWANPDTHSLP